MGLFGKTRFVESEELKDIKVQVKSLVKEKRALTEELEELKLKKRLEGEEIKHMVKINEEKLASELEKDKIKLEREHQKKITELEKKSMDTINKSLVEFHSKMEKKFTEETSNLKELYGMLMQRLPNVNMTISRNEGTPVDPLPIDYRPTKKKRK